MTCFCPKCGARMKAAFVEGSLRAATCEQGDMELSPGVAAEISEQFFETDEAPKAEEMRFALGKAWFCPRDGEALQSEGRIEPSCPSCGRVLRARTIRQLVELHPHR